MSVTILCPECDYNLTGVAHQRCPECGAAVRSRGADGTVAEPPGTAFERAAGALGTLALFQTALTVLLAPWIFARQVQGRPSLPHALAFFIMCLSLTFLSLPFIQASYLYEWDFLTAWLTAVVAFLVVQAGALALVDPAGWVRPGEAFRFWLIVGCYTSAVMMTEFVYGPPRLTLSGMVEMLDPANRPPRFVVTAEMIVWSLQMAAWTAVMTACHVRRLRRARLGGLWVAAAALATPAGLVVLYAAVFEHVGERLYYAIGG